MLEGLEIKEILISEPLESEMMRLESEFYTAETFDFHNTFKGERVLDFVQYGTSEELNEDNEGYPILRLNEFNSAFIGVPSKHCKKISKETFESLKLKKNDVLICRTNGNPKLVGKSALVPSDYNFAYASYLFRIRPKREIINSSTLVCFLNSKFGRMEIEKFSMASNQVNFSPAKFREMRIPKFTNDLNQIIESNFFKAYQFLEDSKATYTQAEKLLLETLGLADFQPSQEPVNVKNFSESFGSSGRLDAEYYQLKYENYLSLISSYPNGHEAFSAACKLMDKNFTPEDKTEYKYIELSNIGKSGEITDCTLAIGEELPTRARRIVATNDVVVSSIEGSLESCALVTSEYNNALCSTGFYVVSSKKLNPETLLVLFKSEPMQALLKKGCSGTILTAISKTELEQIPIPLIESDTQKKIKDYINECFEMRRKSEHLLEVAKTAVEMAIEQDEETALEFINNQTII